jgi:tRNA A37 threonylcarbamoyladenosine dehydratase
MEYTRQEGIFNPEDQTMNITIIGCGSTGSYVAFLLSKMGMKDLTLIDDDTIEAANIPVQIYNLEDIGLHKVEALAVLLHKHNADTHFNIQKRRITEETNDLLFDMNSLVIICVDTMEARKVIYEKIKNIPIKFIDTRYGGEGFSIQVVDLLDDEEKARYEASLNVEAKDLPCGENGIVTAIASLAAEVVNIVKKIEMRQPYPKILKREMKTYRFIGDQDA